MPFYVEFPTDPVVNVHWKKRGEPPPPDGEPLCIGGTWEWDGTSLVIHDALSDRIFPTPPRNSGLAFRAFGNTVEFGYYSVEPDDPDYLKNFFGVGLTSTIGAKLIIEAEHHAGTPNPPPDSPPFPKIPKFIVDPGSPALSFSRITSYNTVPPPAPYPFQDGWNYTYDLTAPYYGGYPGFDPNEGGGPGLFTIGGVGGGISYTPEYQEWYDFFYGGQGNPGEEPPYQGDQFYVPSSSGGFYHIKLTLVCGMQRP